MALLDIKNKIVLDKLLNNWEEVPKKFKHGYQFNKTIYNQEEQIKLIYKLSKKKTISSNSDYGSLSRLNGPLRHTMLSGTFKTIKTSIPNAVMDFLKVDEIAGALAYKDSVILRYTDEILIHCDIVDRIDCSKMEKYILDTFGEDCEFSVDDLTPVIDVSKWSEETPYEMGEDYDKIKEEFEKNNFQIQEPLCYAEITPFNIVFRTSSACAELNLDKVVAGGGKNGDREEQFFPKWLKDASRRTYKKYDCYPPPLSAPEGVYNMWQGFPVHHETESVDCSVFLDHFDNVIGGKEYLLDWMAHIIQKPGEKTLVCPIIRGKSGTGKSIISDTFRLVLGDVLSYHANKLGDILDKHSHARKNRIFISIDEVDAKSGAIHNEHFKDAITSLTFKFEQKRIDEVTLTNFNNFFITTNNEKSLPVQEGERRYSVFDMSDKKMGNHAYFDRIIEWRSNPENLQALYNYLKNRVITHNLKELPETEALHESRILSLPAIVKWWTYRMIESFPKTWGVNYISGNDLFTDYLQFIKVDKEEYNPAKFGLAMKKYIHFDEIALQKKPTKNGVMWLINRKLVVEWLQKKKYTLEKDINEPVEVQSDQVPYDG